jgi:peptide/nickel transport system substrate-binding protein
MNLRDRFALLALALLLAVVGGAMLLPGSADEGSPGPERPAAVTYREAIVGHPSSINPLTARTQVDRDLVALLFRGLAKLGPDGTLVPDLARSWTAAEDGRSYTFYLGDDDRWEDGQPVTVDDVVFTVGLASDPNYQGPLGAEWRGIEATVVSPHVVRIVLPAPMGGFLHLATLPILPRHLLENVAVTDLADSSFSTRPVGDGAFRLVEIDVRHAVLTRVQAEAASESPTGAMNAGAASQSVSNKPSVTPVSGLPQPIEAMELTFFDTETEAAAAFLAGDADAVAGLKPGTVLSAAARLDTELARYPWASMTAVVLNMREAYPEFGAEAVRRALLASIDRPAILTRILGGRGAVADAPLPPWSTWYDSEAISAVPFAGIAADSDLAGAGWVQGRDGWMLPGQDQAYVIRLLTLEEATDAAAYQIAQQVANDWRAMGLQVAVVPVSVGDYRQALQSGQFQAAVVEYSLGLDPDVSPLLLTTQISPAGSNLSGISDATLDRLLTAVHSTSDAKDRRTAVSELESYVTSHVLMLPVCFEDYVFAVSGRVRGRVATQIADPSDRYWDVLDWRLASDG